MNRRALLMLVALFGAVLLGAVAWTLGTSLQPSARSDVALPRIPTGDIAPGTYRFVPDAYDQGELNGEVLLLRTTDGRLSAFYVPGRNGVRSVPDYKAWLPGSPCPELRPDLASGVIACFSASAPDWVKSKYKWSLDGKALSSQVPDLERVLGVEELGFFVYHKRSAA